MKNTKSYSVLFLLLLCPHVTFAGGTPAAKVTVDSRSGTREYSMYETGKIYFSGEYLVVEPDGTSTPQKEKISEIRKLQVMEYSSSGTSLLQGDPDFRIYPNPASDYLEINPPSSAPVQYAIFNLKGEQIASGKIQREGRINLSDIPQGIYTIKLNNTYIKFSKK